MSKKKKIIVLAGMLVLLVATGVLNVYLNKNVPDKANTGVNYQNFFDAYRVDRETTREKTLLCLDAIIGSDVSTSEAIVEAESSKLTITQNMETELVLEGLIKALGYDDVIVMCSQNYVNVVVKRKELTAEDSAKILDVVVSQTNKSAPSVRIIPAE